MKSSWNFSTAIFEIWVLVLTKPGWANETPTTSLRVPRDYTYHHNQHHHHMQHHKHSDYLVGESTSRGYSGSSDNSNHHHHHNHQHHSSSSYFSSGSNNNHNHHPHPPDPVSLPSSLYIPHRCYVCLPPNKNSREAQQILDIFAKEIRPLIPDCSDFDPYVETGGFEFDCPPRYGGCILRIHGTNISRACSRYRVNDCKKANSVEFCYCTTPLCNDKKPERLTIPPAVVHHVSRNAGESSRRRGSNGSNAKSRSSLNGRENGEGEGGNSQGIRVRVSDDEDILNPDDEDDDSGSGMGSPDDQQLQTLIDPFTSTLDPTIFHEETVEVAVEDPNPHTKIGISMTASTSGASSGSSSAILAGKSCFFISSSKYIQNEVSRNIRNIFHLFVHLHKTIFASIFADHGNHWEQDASDGSKFYLISSQTQEVNGWREILVDASKTSSTHQPISPLFILSSSQLCFITSLIVLVKVFLS